MEFSTPFIRRPVATILLSIGLFLAGVAAFFALPIAATPSVDIPTILVFANRPGASPDTMANSIAAPLERHLGEIGGITELTSINSLGASTIVIQFDVGRDIEGAAHDVQTAINAAEADLPGDLPTRPFYKKINPADAPIIELAVTSDTLTPARLFDAADTILAQRLSQIDGVGQVQLLGAQTPAVRIQLDPAALRAAGIAAADVVTAVQNANVTQPTGVFEGAQRAETIHVNGQITNAASYRPLVLRTRNGAALRLGDVANVVDDVANVKLAAWEGRRRAIILDITKTSGANVIQTVDTIKAALPQLLAWMPAGVHVDVLDDRSVTIRHNVDDIQFTLGLTVVLVLLVVLLFLRRAAPTLAAAATVPLSIATTFGVMWFNGYSLDNFSLMALSISIGFVVDDAIVMIENIQRQREAGMPPMQAALVGARQIGFTVISISLSLVAVFTPIIFMTGILGSLFHEFAMTLVAAIATSALVSLTLTPMICAHYGGSLEAPGGVLGRIDRAIENALASIESGYARSVHWVLRRQALMLLVTFATLAGTIMLYRIVPKNFFPQQDTGEVLGATEASPDISFEGLQARQLQVIDTILADPAVASVATQIGVSFAYFAQNEGRLTIALKPYEERHVTASGVIERLRPKLAAIGGMETTLFAAQDIRAGGRSGGAEYQFVLLDQDLGELRLWASRVETAMRHFDRVADVTSDEDHPAPQANVVIDREAAARLQVSANAIDAALGNAFGQRQISVIYATRNQYRVVVETLPDLQRDPSQLDRIYVGAADGTQVPLSAVARLSFGTAALSIRHQGEIPTVTISFNLARGASLSEAIDGLKHITETIGLPSGVNTDFAGNAKFFLQSLQSEPYLIGAALLAIYIVLGVLYESLIHPITILSTLPSAGFGALLAIVITGGQFSFLSTIGVVLLMGLVKKNGILVVDFALEAERGRGMSAIEAIEAACVARFRPIIMTTLAAIAGALPLALSTGVGSEFRQPLGIAVTGGLIVSQALTLYTTPVVYLALERLAGGRRRRLTTAQI